MKVGRSLQFNQLKHNENNAYPCSFHDKCKSSVVKIWKQLPLTTFWDGNPTMLEAARPSLINHRAISYLIKIKRTLISSSDFLQVKQLFIKHEQNGRNIADVVVWSDSPHFHDFCYIKLLHARYFHSSFSDFTGMKLTSNYNLVKLG